MVTERLLHEERKLRENEEGTSTEEKAMATQFKWFKKRVNVITVESMDISVRN